MGARISVIIPVYKTAPYLHRCVESVLAQTFSDFELILVDDGSPDECGSICDGYAANDSRVKVIHKNNGGVSSARNAGLDAAEGDFVFFCDSDDWLSPEILEKAINICNSGFDICAFGHASVSGNILINRCVKENIQRDSEHLKEKDIIELIENNYLTAPWAKLISRALIADNRFDTSLTFGEDMVFNLFLLENDCRLFASTEAAYFYRVNSEGITSNVSVKKCKNAVYVYRFLLGFALSRPDREGSLEEYVKKRWANDYFGLMHQINLSKENRKDRLKMIRILMSDRELTAAASECLTRAEKKECAVLAVKSIFPGTVSVIHRFVKRPEAFKER